MKPSSTPTLYEIPSFLSGRLLLAPGTIADYRALERFHYKPASPATFAQIWTISYIPFSPGEGALAHDHARPIAAAILSYPTLALHLRDRSLNLLQMNPHARNRWVNRNLRSISRVVVHPQFRSLGLAAALVRCILYHNKTRYTEALAVMARAHPFFERGGMTPIGLSRGDDGPLYYLFDRHHDPLDFPYPRVPLPTVASATL